MLSRPQRLLALLLLSGLTSASFAQTVTVTLDETYSSTFKATATVTNDTTEDIDGWLVRLQFNSTVNSNWNSEIVATESTPATFAYAFSNGTFNSFIAPGDSVTFGFIASSSNGNALPTSEEITTPWPPPSGNSVEVLNQNIDAFPTGLHDDDSWLNLWPGTQWTNGPDENRVEVDESITVDGSGKSIKILYPEGTQKPGESGAQWFMDLDGEYEELYMSYWVRFDPDFDFVLGGKLPGLGGALSFSNRNHEWSGRLMWREQGDVEFYIHVPTTNNFDPGVRFWWNTEGYQATFVPGRWHHIEIHFKLNTPGVSDGIMEGWFDGVKAASYTDFYFRDEPSQDTKIAWAFFSTFFGGSSSSIWESTKDEHANFDNFIVSQERIGYPGMPDDIDSDGLPNAWETLHFGSDSAAIPTADADNDGTNNLDEQIAATDPNDASDQLAPTVSATEVSIQGHAGRRYTLQTSTNLIDWDDVETSPLLESDQPITFDRPAGPGTMFFRVVVELP